MPEVWTRYGRGQGRTRRDRLSRTDLCLLDVRPVDDTFNPHRSAQE
jgi:hypothetical protein